MNKETFNKIKEEIKEKASAQRFYKNQRKTEKIVGERTVPAHKAVEYLKANTFNLTCEYIAYYIVKHRLEDKAPVFSEGIYKLSNPDAYREVVAGCCGDKCYMLGDDWVSHYRLNISAQHVDEFIREWNAGESPAEKAH